MFSSGTYRFEERKYRSESGNGERRDKERNVVGSNRKVRLKTSDIRCLKCEGRGHTTLECPKYMIVLEEMITKLEEKEKREKELREKELREREREEKELREREREEKELRERESEEKELREKEKREKESENDCCFFNFNTLDICDNSLLKECEEMLPSKGYPILHSNSLVDCEGSPKEDYEELYEILDVQESHATTLSSSPKPKYHELDSRKNHFEEGEHDRNQPWSQDLKDVLQYGVLYELDSRTNHFEEEGNDRNLPWSQYVIQYAIPHELDSRTNPFEEEGNDRNLPCSNYSKCHLQFLEGPLTKQREKRIRKTFKRFIIELQLNEGSTKMESNPRITTTSQFEDNFMHLKDNKLESKMSPKLNTQDPSVGWSLFGWIT